MKKTSEYRLHAQECRQLAAGMDGDQREQLLEMARAWDRLAHERSELVQRHAGPTLAGEHDNEMLSKRS